MNKNRKAFRELEQQSSLLSMLGQPVRQGGWGIKLQNGNDKIPLFRFITRCKRRCMDPTNFFHLRSTVTHVSCLNFEIYLRLKCLSGLGKH